MSDIIKATPRTLQRWYAHINRAGFGGRLPKVKFLVALDNHYLACTHRRGRKFIITFNKRMMFSRTLCIGTLVHEMVHVEHWSWRHGARFSNRVIAVFKKAKLKRFL